MLRNGYSMMMIMMLSLSKSLNHLRSCCDLRYKLDVGGGYMFPALEDLQETEVCYGDLLRRKALVLQGQRLIFVTLPSRAENYPLMEEISSCCTFRNDKYQIQHKPSNFCSPGNVVTNLLLAPFSTS